MDRPPEPETKLLLSRLRRMQRLARFSIISERIVSAWWPAACWTLLFAAAWLLQIPPFFGAIGNGIALAVFAGGLFYFIRRALRNYHRPYQKEIDRRLEKHSGLLHRPLDRIQDRLANPDKDQTLSLWQAGYERAMVALGKLRIPFPRPVLARHDPWGLRILVVLFVFIGLFVAGPQWRERLAFGLAPFSIHWQDRISDNIVIWIAPPAYTSLAEVTLQGSGKLDKTIDLPEGSVIKARVRNGLGQPRLVMGETEILLTPLDKDDKKSWSVETQAIPAEKIAIRQLVSTRATIPVRFIPDTPPHVVLKESPKTLPKGALQIPLLVKDDYGVTDIHLRLELDPSIEDAPLGSAYEDVRAVMSPPNVEQELFPVFDLTWHPWAGLPVVIALEGRDHKGQVSNLEPIKLTLPERAFQNPLAQVFVEARKRLIWTPAAAALNVADELENVLVRPDLYNGDIVVFLSLRSIISRLRHTQDQQTAIAVIEHLWDLALRVEDGNLTLAARNLRDARESLEALLNDPNATDEQIAQAMEEFRQALASYFQELYREMQRRMASNEGMPPVSAEAMMQNLDAEELASFLDKLQAESLSGNRDTARQMLSQLQQLMDMMDPSLSMEPPKEMKAMMEGMQELQDLIQQQQDLLDRTQKEMQPKPEPGKQTYAESLPLDQTLLEEWGGETMPPPPERAAPQPETARKPNSSDSALKKDEQESLRLDLGSIMSKAGEQLPEIPPNLQQAEQAMRGSSEALAQNKPDLSIPHQEEALRHLRESMNEMNQQLMAMMKQMTLMSFGGGRLDPLGRPMNDGEDGNSLLPGAKVKIPDEAQRKRAQEILQILRQRSGDFSRPDYELEYYRRLMKQF